MEVLIAVLLAALVYWIATLLKLPHPLPLIAALIALLAPLL